MENIQNEENSEENNNYLKNITPWNSGEFPVKINNIRYNQDNSLLTLATSKGYKIFSTEKLIQVHEETDKVRDLGDLDIVMTYYSTSLVFFTFTKDNKNYTTKELIVFDDFKQNIISSFKSKKQNITNFYVSKYCIFIVLETEIIIMELLTFKIINIINNIYSERKLCSFNAYGFVGFTKKNEKYKVYIKIVNQENGKIISLRNRCIRPNFEYIQSLNLSPSGQLIAISSIFGNKIHIYYVENLILKECFYLGNEINEIYEMSFPGIGEGFLLIQLNRKKFKLFGFSNILEGQFKCKCYKYKNDDLVKDCIKKKENEDTWFNYISNIFNYSSIEENSDESKELICIEVKEGILFLNFIESDMLDKNRNNNIKEIVVINEKGHYYKFSFNAEDYKLYNNINLFLKESIQWM